MVQCICGQQTLIAVSDVIAMRGKEIHVDDVELPAKCKRCKSKGIFAQYQIMYLRNSEIAMLGSEVQEQVKKVNMMLFALLPRKKKLSV